MKSSALSGTVIAFPTTKAKAQFEAAPVSAAMQAKAYNAYHNAKQRCTNPQNPSYAQYGALGVSFLFSSFGQFVDDVGFPEKKAVSLDRIDPNGNYEPGNIRWANKHVQAVNKKGSAQGSILPPAAIMKSALAMKATLAKRAANTRNWELIVDAINRGGFTQKDVAAGVADKLDGAMLENGWELGQIVDWAEPPSFFHLPSLTMPGHSVRLAGGPFPPATGTVGLGTLQGLGRLSPQAALPEDILKLLPAGVLGSGKGLLLVGSPSPGLLQRGGVEGLFLYLASRLRHGPSPQGAVFQPMLAVVERLKGLGSPFSWSEQYDDLLDAGHLFIPDVQIATGGSDQLQMSQWSRFIDLVRHRVEYGRRNYLAVHNLNGLPKFVVAELATLPMHEVPPFLTGGEPFATYVANSHPNPKIRGFNALKEAISQA